MNTLRFFKFIKYDFLLNGRHSDGEAVAASNAWVVPRSNNAALSSPAAAAAAAAVADARLDNQLVVDMLVDMLEDMLEEDLHIQISHMLYTGYILATIHNTIAFYSHFS